ncbi:calcium homeostasis modulator protein 6-like [Pseudorasbora parva]|uniref:calcium homeostasis modulator protein 6-like n=1 Tax=Pseudorasbora parva TaxID=51549 RepID=UPI00351EEBCB
MTRPEDILGHIHGFLRQSPVFSSFPPSLLLMGLEEFTGKLVFVCPCKEELNVNLTESLFIGPTLLIFALMYFVLRPFKHGCSRCCAGANDDTQQNCPKALAACLIPPVMWIFFLLLDGNYVACAKTHWEGVYVFDVEINRSWCKPMEGFQNEQELQHLVQTYVLESQYTGYVMIGVFSAFVIISVAIYDCWISGKFGLLRCRGQTPVRNEDEEQGPATKEQEVQVSMSSATTGQRESWSSATVGQKQQSSVKVEWQPKSSSIVDKGLKESRGSATTGHGLQGLGRLATEGHRQSTEMQILLSHTGQQIEATTL